MKKPCYISQGFLGEWAHLDSNQGTKNYEQLVKQKPIQINNLQMIFGVVGANIKVPLATIKKL